MKKRLPIKHDQEIKLKKLNNDKLISKETQQSLKMILNSKFCLLENHTQLSNYNFLPFPKNKFLCKLTCHNRLPSQNANR